MSIKGLDLEAKHTHHSKFDAAKKGSPKATVWEYGVLDSRVMGHLKDLATRMHIKPGEDAGEEGVETTIDTNEVAFQTVQFGLTGFKNFEAADGGDITYKTTKRNLRGKDYTILSASIVEQIPGNVLAELAEVIRKANEVEDTEKND